MRNGGKVRDTQQVVKSPVRCRSEAHVSPMLSKSRAMAISDRTAGRVRIRVRSALTSYDQENLRIDLAELLGRRPLLNETARQTQIPHAMEVLRRIAAATLHRDQEHRAQPEQKPEHGHPALADASSGP